MDIAPTVRLRTREISRNMLPGPLEIDEALGLAKDPRLQGQVVHVARSAAKTV